MKDLPPIFIKAISPGYTVDSQSNVGEFIELARNSFDTSFLLTNLVLKYTNSSGNAVVLYAFPEGSLLDGENLLLRFAGSPNSELANATYTKTLAMSAGPLELVLDGEIIDSVCWNSKNECISPFRSNNPTILVRNDDNTFSHQTLYEPVYNSSSLHLTEESTASSEPILVEDPPPAEITPEIPALQCQGLQFSEIFTYYENTKSEQFIEFYNSTAKTIHLDGCSLRYKNKIYPLSGTISPGVFSAYASSDISLTKNPTSSNTIELLDTNSTIVDTLTYPSQKKSTSYAKIDGIWQQTYAITKNQANVFQKYQTCEEGKTINEATGKCIKVSPTTNTAADYAVILEPQQATEESFVALYAVLAILAIGCIYIIFQFRVELTRLFGKVFRRSRQKPHRALDHH